MTVDAPAGLEDALHTSILAAATDMQIKTTWAASASVSVQNIDV